MAHKVPWDVTTKEVLQILGIRANLLEWLERRARVRRQARRQGYSAPEVRRLLASLKKAVSASE